jgi:hypothetical protein
MRRYVLSLILVLIPFLAVAAVPSPCHPNSGQDVCDFYSGFNMTGAGGIFGNSITLDSPTIKACGGAFNARTINFVTEFFVLSQGASVTGELHLDGHGAAPRVLVCNGAKITGNIIFAANHPGIIFKDAASQIVGTVSNGNIIPVA